MGAKDRSTVCCMFRQRIILMAVAVAAALMCSGAASAGGGVGGGKAIRMRRLILFALLTLPLLAVQAAAAVPNPESSPPSIICPGPDEADACPPPPPPPPPPPTPPPPACSDGWDNDGDWYVDAGGDVGCMGNPWGTSEDDYNVWATGSEVDGGGANYGWLSGDARGTCWQRESKRSKGILAYTRRLSLLTTWCARFGTTISYRFSSSRTHHDTFCGNSSGPYVTKTAGGTGNTFVDVQAWVEIECGSIPTNWPKYHDTLMMRMRYLPDGRVVRLAYE